MTISISESEEHALIDALINKDERAFRQAIRLFQSSMLGLARSIVGDSIAEEIVQDSWLAVLNSLVGFERRSRLKTWILRIVSNMAKTRLRYEKRCTTFTDMLTTAMLGNQESGFDENEQWRVTHAPSQWHENTPDALLTCSELHCVLVKTINALPPLQQAVIKLRDIEGLSTREVSEVLSLSEMNSRVILHRARLVVKKSIDAYQSGRNRDDIDTQHWTFNETTGLNHCLIPFNLDSTHSQSVSL